jgi:hypothetical protein
MKVYAIVNCKSIVEPLFLNLSDAQENLMNYAFESGCSTYNYCIQNYSTEISMREANIEMDSWRIWEYEVI